MGERRNGAARLRAASKEKMKHVKKIISLLAAICCLAGGVSTLYAGVPDTSEEEVPRIVFTNKPKESPDLYVTKTVESAAEGYDLPDYATEQAFTFVLELDGKPAKNMRYHKFQGSEEVKNPDDPNGFQTGADGRFSLSHGQQAVFLSQDIRELTPKTRYKVTEDKSDGYLGSGPVEDTVTEYGSTAAFVNKWMPNVEQKDATLEVQKSFSFPSGYELLAQPEFTFSLRLDNKPWANKTYDIVPLDNTEAAGPRRGTTDENGIFKLQGGYKAVFAGDKDDPIKSGMDYQVQELDLPEGWRVTDTTGTIVSENVQIGGVDHNASASQEGSTSAVTLAYVNNAIASFGVSKELEEDSVKPEDGSVPDFIFELTRADRSVWEGADYYLYEARKLVGNEEEGKDFYSTDEKGRFTLKPGQTAIFFGIPSGEKYNVKEVPAEEGTGDILYIQTLPESVEGYRDQTVGNGDAILPFKNKGQKVKKTLNVTKTVVNDKGEASAAQEQDKFWFTLKRKDKEGAYGPVEDALYEVGSEKRRTEKGGRFYIKAGEMAQFKLLSANQIYQVAEESGSLPPEYEARTDPQEEKLTMDGLVNFTFVNAYKADKLELALTKVDAEDRSLGGAGFTLYWDEACTNPVGEVSTDKDGKATFGDLKAATYYLKETKAPSGYVFLKEPIEIKVGRTKDGLSVTVDGVEYKKPESGTEMATGKDVVTKIDVSLKDEDDPDSKDTVKITVRNSELYGLPSTGGPGIFWYTIGGILLMMAAAILYRYQCAGEVFGKR